MSVFQIWGSFLRGDRECPTTTSCFKKGQLMGDGITTMEDFEKSFAAEDEEDLVLLKEFEPNPEVWLTPQAEQMMASQMCNMFMDGWFHHEEGDVDDSSTPESETDGASPDL